MTNREYQLDDEMIVSLMEARLEGAEFSAAVKSSKIPELLVPEAKDYWNIFTDIETVRDVRPRADAFERIMSEVAPVTTPRFVSPFSTSPLVASPYMKQLFAVAGAFAALVIVISAVDFTTTAPILNGNPGVTLNPDAIPDHALTKMDAPLAKASPEVMSFAAPDVPAPAPIVAAAPRPAAARMMSFAKMDAPQNEKDPEHLFAVLSQTGTHEATPDTYIDDAYDQQLAEYDAAMTGSTTDGTSTPSNDTDHAK